MKYLIMIYSNPASRAAWAGFSAGEREAGFARHAALREAMAAAGELVTSAALDQPETGRVLSGGMLTDGPFAEVKEHLAGFYLVDCPSPERAAEWAARVPEAAHVSIEVRPLL